ncbi:MAG: hypothetical protein GOP50_05635 [Candidatus Heimdallarchaeota archaeon]|nr:hypothetical protein [Candidatus Heimdallarchaeota archaeon]
MRITRLVKVSSILMELVTILFFSLSSSARNNEILPVILLDPTIDGDR